MKTRLSDTWIRTRVQSLDAGTEVYDDKEAGLVLRAGKRGAVWYLYADRGRRKLKLGTWPEFDTSDARRLCSNAKGAPPTKRGRGSIPVLQTYFTEEYRPEYELTHKSTAALYNMSEALAEFGRDRLDKIDAPGVRAWMLRRRKADIAPSTVNRQKNALSACLSTAVPTYLASNPMREVKSLQVDQENRIRYLDDDEEERLRRALLARETRIREERASANEWRLERNYPPLEDLSNLPFADHLRPMVLLSINTGLRQNELFSLEWRNVTKNAVRVTAAVSKSRKSRSVPLNAEALGTLDGWRAQAGDSGYVFKGRVGKFDNVRKAWAGVLKDAKIEDFTWHDMRHNFASSLVMRGVPLNSVRELLGHASLTMVLRYSHLSPRHLQDAVRVLDQ